MAGRARSTHFAFAIINNATMFVCLSCLRRGSADCSDDGRVPLDGANFENWVFGMIVDR